LKMHQRGSKEGDLRGFEWYYLWRQGHADRHTLLGHRGLVTAVAVSADGKTAASASQDGSVRLWDVAQGLERALFKGHRGGVQGVAFSPDGGPLASVGEDGAVLLWDATAGKDKHAIIEQAGATLADAKGAVRAVTYSPDGKTLATGGADGDILLWDA